jgi:predicted ATPase/DNA-binding winged helix-turn-helix (wHTH) protein
MEPSRDAISFQGGRIHLDTRTRAILVDGRPAKLGGRAFDLLEALVARRDRVVPKQELLDVVWPGLIVEENNLQVHVVTLRKLLGPQSIVTVQGRGYRLALAPDDAWNGDGDERVAPAAAPTEQFGGDTSLFGRESLIASSCALLRRNDVRVVTLTGPGGSGKTRVGLRLTAELAHDFVDGSYVVMLAAVRDATHVPAAIATVLHVQEAGALPLTDLVVNHLRSREALLTLDNFEHLGEARPLISTLLDACPRIKLLLTSRSMLKLAAEHVVVVPPLRLPDRRSGSRQALESPSVRLFLQRARESGRDIGNKAEDLEAAFEICRRVDGLPLAIELAAARLRVLSPRSLLERLGNRLQVLKGGADDIPARQKTLRDAIEWSHDLLSAEEQKLFRRLAVFVGGWTLDAAEAIATGEDLTESVLDLLTRLMDHSLVQRVDDVDGAPRFAILETVREYASDRLEASGEMATIRQRHSEHFSRLAQTAEANLTSAQRKPWLARLQADYNNLRSALSWVAVERIDTEAALQLTGALPWMWYFTSQYSEGRGWMRLVLALVANDRRDAAVAKLLSGAARLAMYSGSISEAIDLASRSVTMWRELGDRRGLAFALAHQAIPLIVSRQRDAADGLMRECKQCFTDLDDAWGIAFAATYMGANLAFAPGTEEAARPLLVEGRARFRTLSDDWGVTTSSHYLGSIALRQADYDSARELTEEMLAIARELGDNYRVSRNLHQLAEISLAEGNLVEAHVHLTACLVLNRDQGRVGDAAQQLRMLARIDMAQNRPRRAVRTFGAASIHDSKERTLPPDDPAVNAAALAEARKAVGDRTFESEWSLGVAMSLDQAVLWSTSRDGRLIGER